MMVAPIDRNNREMYIPLPVTRGTVIVNEDNSMQMMNHFVFLSTDS